MPARLFFALTLLLLQQGRVLRAQMTSVSEVLALDVRQVEHVSVPVKLSGVAVNIGAGSQRFHLHDGVSSVLVVPSAGLSAASLGQAVEVMGNVVVEVRGGSSHLQVVAQSVTASGTKPLPAAKPISLNTLNSFSHWDQWVSVEGYVLDWSYRKPLLTIKLVTQENWSTAKVILDDPTKLPANLHGAKLRLTGINSGDPTAFDAMQVPGLDQLEVLELGTADIFDAPLVSIADVNKRAVEGGKRLRVRGTLAATMEERKFIIQGEGGAMVGYMLQSRGSEEAGTLYGDAGQWPSVQPGDVVELVGSVVNQSSIMRTYGLSWTYVRVVGNGTVPTPEKVSIEQLLSYRNGDHWVTVEATVGAWMFQRNTMMYVAADPHAEIIFGVRGTPVPASFPMDLYGARARFTGIANSLSITSLGCDFIVPNPSFVEILKPGRTDAFDVKEHTASDIVNDHFAPAEPVKTKGVVVAHEGVALYVRGEGATLCAGLQLPWSRPANTSGMSFADCGPLPEIKVGDKVVIMGMPVRSPTNPFDLSSTNVRVLGHQDKVEPTTTTLTRIANGEHTSDLVQVRGRLLTWQVAPLGGGKWRTTFLLKSDGTKLTAVHQGTVLHPFDTLRPDDDILIEAVVDRATPQSPRQLHLLSPSDAKSLGVSADIISKRLWIYGGGALSLLALFSGWIVALRKSNRSKTEIATLLEQRVNERTTELRQSQAELGKALEYERELSELKSRFVTTVSHEFRTPLGIIMSAVELMRHYDERLPTEQRRELCDDIHSSTRLMAGLMEQVLVLGRVEAGKLGYRPAAIDIDTLAGKLTDEPLSATNRRCPIHWQPQGSLEGARADEALLRHIFSNLITNAVKYSPEGIAVEFTARREGADAVFQVIDHGIGIPAKDRAHLFEAFHRCSNVGEIPGTGLGLVIVKRCVELHNGTMEMDSVVGHGTTFTVRLPLFESSV